MLPQSWCAPVAAQGCCFRCCTRQDLLQRRHVTTKHQLAPHLITDSTGVPNYPTHSEHTQETATSRPGTRQDRQRLAQLSDIGLCSWRQWRRSSAAWPASSGPKTRSSPPSTRRSRRSSSSATSSARRPPRRTAPPGAPTRRRRPPRCAQRRATPRGARPWSSLRRSAPLLYPCLCPLLYAIWWLDARRMCGSLLACVCSWRQRVDAAAAAVRAAERDAARRTAVEQVAPQCAPPFLPAFCLLLADCCSLGAVRCVFEACSAAPLGAAPLAVHQWSSVSSLFCFGSMNERDSAAPPALHV